MRDMEELYGHLWQAHGDQFAILDKSLAPRSWTYSFEVAARHGLSAAGRAIDVGCGRGVHCFELTQRFGCRVTGFDVVAGPLREAAASAERPKGVNFVQADIRQLPIASEAVDFVWCRDMLVHVPDLERAVAECARVLRRGCPMLVFATVATGRLHADEAERVARPLSLVPKNLSRAFLQGSFASAGLEMVDAHDFRSELIEFYEERDGRASREMMRLARLRRRRESFEEVLGVRRVEVVEALYEWVTYILMGKLSSHCWVLRKR